MRLSFCPIDALDKQLRETVRAFEQTRGVVAAIEGTSAQLKEALENRKQIIVTTLQKFPQIVDAVEEMSNRKFALVIDEAHSSQGGENAQAVGKVLSTDGHIVENPTYEDMIHDQMSAKTSRQHQYLCVHSHPQGQDSGAVWKTKNRCSWL